MLGYTVRDFCATTPHQTYLREYPNAIQDDLPVLSPSISILFPKKKSYLQSRSGFSSSTEEAIMFVQGAFVFNCQSSFTARQIIPNDNVFSSIPASFCKELGSTEVSASNLVLSCPPLSNWMFIMASVF